MKQQGQGLIEFVIVLAIIAVLAYGAWAIMSGNGIDLPAILSSMGAECDPSKSIWGCGG